MFRWKEAKRSIEFGEKGEDSVGLGENSKSSIELDGQSENNLENSMESEVKSLNSIEPKSDSPSNASNSIEPMSDSPSNASNSIESEEEWRDSLYEVGSFSLVPFVSGHFASARAGFSRFGHLLISCSLDRTVRLWGREFCDGRWKEVGRPVVHGYPVTGVSWLKDHRNMDGLEVSNEEIGRLVTINEEKKCRIYENTYLNLFVLNSLVESADSVLIKHPSIERSSARSK